MRYLLVIPAVISFWLLAAHYLRDLGGPTGVTPLPLFLFTMAVLAPFLFLWHNRLILRMLQFLLVCAAVVQVATGFDLFRQRLAEHRPFRALVVIMTAVTLWTLISALLLQPLRRLYPKLASTDTAPPPPVQ